MKKHLFYVVMFGLGTAVVPCQAQTKLAGSSINLETGRIFPSKDKADEDKRFYFRIQEFLLEEFDADAVYDAHFLGDTVARKMHRVNSLYIKKSDLTVGFGHTHVEILKPTIYNALNKVERHLKKAVRKEEISTEKAAAIFSLYLDYAVAIFHDPESSAFEEALSKARNAGEMMELFESVEMEVI